MSSAPDTFKDKHPLADRPITLDWTADMPTGAAIANSDWTIEGPDASLEHYGDDKVGFKTTTRLRGGTDGAQYKLTNKMTTDQTPPQILVSVKLINVRTTPK